MAKAYKAYVTIGSNVGNRLRNIKSAIRLLESSEKILRKSAIYETEPMFLKNQRWFYNCAVCIETEKSPKELLLFLKWIEKSLGRKRRKRYGPREIDLDIVFYGSKIIREKYLQIPHSDIQNRMFVLRPLCDIGKRFIHPVLKKSVFELKKELEKTDKSKISKLKNL